MLGNLVKCNSLKHIGSSHVNMSTRHNGLPSGISPKKFKDGIRWGLWSLGLTHRHSVYVDRILDFAKPADFKPGGLCGTSLAPDVLDRSGASATRTEKELDDHGLLLRAKYYRYASYEDERRENREKLRINLAPLFERAAELLEAGSIHQRQWLERSDAQRKKELERRRELRAQKRAAQQNQ